MFVSRIAFLSLLEFRLHGTVFDQRSYCFFFGNDFLLAVISPHIISTFGKEKEEKRSLQFSSCRKILMEKCFCTWIHKCKVWGPLKFECLPTHLYRNKIVVYKPIWQPIMYINTWIVYCARYAEVNPSSQSNLTPFLRGFKLLLKILINLFLKSTFTIKIKEIVVNVCELTLNCNSYSLDGIFQTCI